MFAISPANLALTLLGVALEPEGAAGAASPIEAFSLQRIPVTNDDYLAFVRAHAEWQRGQVPATMADSGYLQHWFGPLELGPQARADQPVAHVSWFAARVLLLTRGTFARLDRMGIRGCH